MNTQDKKYYLAIAASFAVWESMNISGVYIPYNNLDKVLHSVVGYSLNGILSNKYKISISMLAVSAIAIGWEIFEKIASYYGIPLTLDVGMIESLKDIVSTMGGALMNNLLVYLYKAKR